MKGGPGVICARPGVRLAAAGAAVTNLSVHIIKIGINDPYFDVLTNRSYPTIFLIFIDALYFLCLIQSQLFYFRSLICKITYFF